MLAVGDAPDPGEASSCVVGCLGVRRDLDDECEADLARYDSVSIDISDTVVWVESRGLLFSWIMVNVSEDDND